MWTNAGVEIENCRVAGEPGCVALQDHLAPSNAWQQLLDSRAEAFPRRARAIAVVNELKGGVELVPAFLPQCRHQVEQAQCFSIKRSGFTGCGTLVDLVDNAVGVMGAVFPFQPGQFIDGDPDVLVAIFTGSFGYDVAGPPQNRSAIFSDRRPVRHCNVIKARNL